MENQIKNWLRWGVVGVVGVMMALNLMIGLDFEKGKILPDITLIGLGNIAFAQSESGNCFCNGSTQDCSSPCDYGNGSNGVCNNCASWNPYSGTYEKGLSVVCWSAPGFQCTDSPCYPGSC